MAAGTLLCCIIRDVKNLRSQIIRLSREDRSCEPKKTTVTISFIDKESRKPVKANGRIIIKSKSSTEPLHSFDSVSNTTTDLPLNGSYSLKSEAINYFDNITEIKTNATGQELKLLLR